MVNHPENFQASNAHANDRPLGPLESPPKTPESMSFTAIMANELSTAPAKLLNQESVFDAKKGGSDHLDFGNWSPENEVRKPQEQMMAAPTVKSAELNFDSAPQLNTAQTQRDIFAQADRKLLQFV